jgi:hypothetical protein
MLSTKRLKSILVPLLLVSITPIWLGVTCPGTNGNGIIVPDPDVILVNENQASPYFVTFTPDVGRVVTVSVTGSLTASRPEIDVTPIGGSVVVDKTVANGQVTSNSTNGTFTPTSSTVHILSGTDDAGVGGDFSINVTQVAP